MTMNVEEVLAAEIPDCEHIWVMDLIQYELGRHSTCIVPEKKESFCASFSALMDLAKGEKRSSDYRNGYRDGYRKAKETTSEDYRKGFLEGTAAIVNKFSYLSIQSKPIITTGIFLYDIIKQTRASAFAEVEKMITGMFAINPFGDSDNDLLFEVKRRIAELREKP